MWPSFMPGRIWRRTTKVDRLNRTLRHIPPSAVYLVGVLPFLWIVGLTVTNALGPDPVKEIELRLGLLSLQFLVAGLCVTPLRWVGLNLIRYRRSLGLIAFFYLLMHVVTWAVLDMGLRLDQIAADLVKRWFILIGMGAFLLMLPLAATSNSASIRRLGAARWQSLHRLTYAAVLAGAVHYVMVAKVWLTQPLVYLGAIVLLLVLRVARNIRRARPVQA